MMSNTTKNRYNFVVAQLDNSITWQVSGERLAESG